MARRRLLRPLVVAAANALDVLLRHRPLPQPDGFEGIVKGAVTRYDLDNLESLEFVMRNALGGGATRTLMMDQTGKAFGPNLLRVVLDVEE